MTTPLHLSVQIQFKSQPVVNTDPLSDIAGGTLQIIRTASSVSFHLCFSFIYAKSFHKTCEHTLNVYKLLELPFRGEQPPEETTGGALDSQMEGIWTNANYINYIKGLFLFLSHSTIVSVICSVLNRPQKTYSLSADCRSEDFTTWLLQSESKKKGSGLVQMTFSLWFSNFINVYILECLYDLHGQVSLIYLYFFVCLFCFFEKTCTMHEVSVQVQQRVTYRGRLLFSCSQYHSAAQ